MRRTPLRRMSERVTGDDMLAVLAALANPHRLRVLAALQADGRSYVSQLARKSASAGRCCTCICRSWRRPVW